MTDLPPACVLFDLDGTLIDTAPDMAGTLRELCEADGVEPPSYAQARTAVTNGGAGLLRLAFGDLTDEDLGRRLLRFLNAYEARIADHSRLYDGMHEVLAAIESRGAPWGVVTNKPERLSVSLMSALGLSERAACIVGGDSLSQRKPHPAPLLHAATSMSQTPQRCVYIGDNLRDIRAGKAAGMTTVAASWGYIAPDDDIHAWEADIVADRPLELIELLSLTADVARD